MHLSINLMIMDQKTERTRKKKTKLHVLKRKEAVTYKEEFPASEGRGRNSTSTSKPIENLNGRKRNCSFRSEICVMQQPFRSRPI